MPRVSLVGDGHGGAEDYATGDLWWTAESGVDYGSQIEAICKGDCGDLDATGTTPHGYSIDSDGVDYDGANHLDLPVFITLYLDSENGTAKNFRIIQSSIFTAMGLGASNTLAERFHVSFGSGASGFALRMFAAVTNRVARSFVLDCTNSSRAQAVQVGFNRIFDATNYIIFGAEVGCSGSSGNQNYINGFSFNNSNIDYEGDAELTNAASEDLTGSVGWTGYTSAELVNFGSSDYRTKSTSDLADDGAGGFIGAFLEAGGGGISLTVTEILNSFTDTSNISIDYNVSATITETLNSFSDTSVVSVTSGQVVDLTVTETLSAFTDASNVNVSVNVELLVTEVLNSFLDGANVTIAKDITLQVTEMFSAFADNSSVRLPANWTDKIKVTTTYTTQTPTSTAWIDKG